MNGYKPMLRDRMPKMLDLALRWCKAKNRWIDYVYNNIVSKYPLEKRSSIVKTILGIKQYYKRQEIYDHIRYNEFKSVTMKQINSIPKSELYMKFKDTINWNKLLLEDLDMYKYWEDVAEWVDWFSTSYIAIESTYNYWTSKRWNVSDNEVKKIISHKFGISIKLTNFLIKSFK